MDLTFECALFVAGLVFGSFLNVCISRIPRDESIVTPGSHCAACDAPVRWHDNIPLVSWIVLRGRCRDCRARISWRYPAVELLTGLLFVMCFAWFGATWLTVKFCVFCFLLVGLIFMDAETGLLPREFTYTGTVLGLGLSWLAPADSSGTALLLRAYAVQLSATQLSLLDSALGALAGAAFFYLVWALYYLVRKRHGLGFGDIAFMAMSGAFLGLKLTLLVLFAAPVLGALYSILILLRRGLSPKKARDSAGVRDLLVAGEIPFGVFLGTASLVAVFFGEGIWQWYLSFLG